MQTILSGHDHAKYQKLVSHHRCDYYLKQDHNQSKFIIIVREWEITGRTSQHYCLVACDKARGFEQQQRSGTKIISKAPSTREQIINAFGGARNPLQKSTFPIL